MVEDERPYRPNVGIMVINEDGLIWIGHRAQTIGIEFESDAQLWQMPQGGIDQGEDAETAARRELYEETGIKSVTLIGQTKNWVYYDFPSGLTKKIAKKYRGQKQMWFVYRFNGSNTEIQITPPPDGHKSEFDDWRWCNKNEIVDLVVPFKREVYDQVLTELGHLATAK